MENRRYNNEIPGDRAALANALAQAGLPAMEIEDDGMAHVVVPLARLQRDGYQAHARNAVLISEVISRFNNYYGYAPHLFITTRSRGAGVDIGISGEDCNGNAVTLPVWEHTGDLDGAVDIVRRLWEQRDRWLRSWLDGRMVRCEN